MEARERGGVRPKITAALADPERRRELTVAQKWGYTLDQWRALPFEDRETLLAHHDLVCPSCGNLRAECSDPDRDWHPHTSTCWATATQEWAIRRLQDKYPREGHNDAALHPLDGAQVWIAAVEPDTDAFDLGVAGGDED